jgi:hypothetical protein
MANLMQTTSANTWSGSWTNFSFTGQNLCRVFNFNFVFLLWVNCMESGSTKAKGKEPKTCLG